MTNPRDDLMALVADAIRDADCVSDRIIAGRYRANLSDTEMLRNRVRQLASALYTAISRPATQVVDPPSGGGIARLIEALERISTLTSGGANAFNARDMHLTVKVIADAALYDYSNGTPAEPVEAEHPALEWSLSDDAKRRLSEIDENIRHAVIASPGMKAGGIQSGPDAVGEPIAASPYEGKMVVDARLLHALWCYGNLHTVEGVIYSPGSHQECLAQVNALFRERSTHPPAQPDISAEEMREALLDATANLVGAASAYRKHAARHRSIGRAIADPFFTTRAGDLEKAAERAQAAIHQLPTSKLVNPEKMYSYNSEAKVEFEK